MKLRSLLLLLALIFAGVLPTAASRTIPPNPIVQSANSAAKASAPVEIPFELANRHIIMKVKVENSRPLSFVLDTGDKYSVISMDRARELGLKLRGSIQMGGAGAELQRGAFVEDASFTIPGLPDSHNRLVWLCRSGKWQQDWAMTLTDSSGSTLSRSL